MVPNPFTADSANPTEMKAYYHPDCMFDTLLRSRATTKVIDSPDDIEVTSPEKHAASSGEATTSSISKDAPLKAKKEKVKSKSNEPAAKKAKTAASKTSTSKKKGKKGHVTESYDESDEPSGEETKAEAKDVAESGGKKSSGRAAKTDTSESSTKKSSRITRAKPVDTAEASSKKTSGKAKKVERTESSSEKQQDTAKSVSKFDMFKLFCKLCGVIGLEGVRKGAYEAFQNSRNLQAVIEKCQTVDVKESLLLESGIVLNTPVKPMLKSLLFRIDCRATCLELKYIIRLIMKDLRVNAGAKHMLEGVRKGAYEAFQNSRDLQAVIEKCQTVDVKESLLLESGIVLNTPVKPMLAESCRSVEQAMSKFSREMYAEIKYDGERLQLHKDGDNFTFFSRSLKPALDHKVIDLNKAVAEAFPTNRNLIVDAEMLLVDTKSGKPLPFGTMGIHKKKQFTDAVVCLFVFDCIYYDDRSLMEKPLRERRKFLEEHLKEVPYRVLLSNSYLVKKGENEKLKALIWKAIDEGLEGLVKKDYLEEGAMADTADLIVLGAYYGTGSKGGMMSVFLMGVYDEKAKKFCTVTKCGNGHDDATLDRINKELTPKMQKISGKFEKLPSWIQCSRSLVPDFIAIDPKESPVWEIRGAEFSRSDNHTADGISIRFPRVTKIRDDKNWETATNLQELKKLFDLSKAKSDVKIDDAVPLYAKHELNVPLNDDAASASSSKKRKRKMTEESAQSDEEAAGSAGSANASDSEKETKKSKIPCKCVFFKLKILKKFA
ncbi:unnamed protein product [Gongylonema pulchrum]|uniref:DNA ligase 3 n=1 Tax=Gongylonema pulchrum TaxID=637853 RepID=A0A183DPJ4_9BILA|nr:unnamed protein product [Gongylonema pulchrum]